MSLEKAFVFLLDNSLSAAWVLLAVLLLRLLLGKAPKRTVRLLWLLPGLRLLLPFSVESVMSLMPSKTVVPMEILISDMPRVSSNIPPMDTAVNFALSQSFSHAPAASANPMQIFMFVCGLVWLLGLTALLLTAIIAAARLRRRVGDAVREDDGLWRTDRIGSPFILGVIRPRIYLPFTLEGESLELVLRHERCHLKGGDHILKLLGYILVSLYWFNPLVWLGYVLFCRDTELACDERVIADLDENSRRLYSLTLLSCAERGASPLLCPTAFGEIGVKERIKKVMKFKKPALWISLLSLLVLAVAALCLLTDPKDSATIGIIGGADGPTAVYVSEGKKPAESLPPAEEGDGVYLTLDFPEADGVCSLNFKCMSYEGEASQILTKPDGGTFAENERVYLIGADELDGTTCMSVAAYDSEGALLATCDFEYWFMKIVESGKTELRWSEAGQRQLVTRGGKPGVTLCIDERCQMKFYSLVVEAYLMNDDESAVIAGYDRLYSHSDGTPYTGGELIDLGTLGGFEGPVNAQIILFDEAGEQIYGCPLYQLGLDGESSLLINVLPIIAAKPAGEGEVNNAPFCDAANKELKKLYEMGLLSRELSIVTQDSTVIDYPAGDTSARDAQVRNMPAYTYVSGKSADEKYSIHVSLDNDSGKIINLSVSAGADADATPVPGRQLDWNGQIFYYYDNFADIFPEDMSLDGLCQILNDYWGFGGYQITDTDGDYGHFDAPDGGAKLTELAINNFYVTVFFKGDQDGAPMFIQVSSFPNYVVLMAGTHGHAVG